MAQYLESRLESRPEAQADSQPDSQPDEAALAARRQLRDRRTQAVVGLLARRRELAGLNPWADHVHESVAWTA